MNRSIARVITAAVVVALTTVGGTTAAQAKQGVDDASGQAHHAVAVKSPRVTATGTCGNAVTKLKVSAEDTGTQVEFELDQNVSGKKWSLVLKRNGAVLDRASRTTSGPSGSLHWRVAPAGASTGTFAVTSTRGGTTCTLTATL